MRITLLGRDQIGEQMAGPGIRYWELAHALAARDHEVTLVAPGLGIASDSVVCLEQGSKPMNQILHAQDAVLTQWVTPTTLRSIQRSDVRLVIDAYDPMMLEGLEQNRLVDLPLRKARGRSLHGVQSLALLAADAVVCASERQRDLWLGALMTSGRLTPAAYDEDDTLRALIDVVPFGCPSTEPRRVGPGPRELFGLDDDAVVLLWGGGIWDWFDPLVILRALDRLRGTHPQIKLVFMGVQHPATGSSASDKAVATAALADQLGLTGTSVFYNAGWVSYENRQSFLLDADAGVSAHLDHAETRFSFRTRVLDYFWAGLPCLVTEGDSMADLVGATGAGEVLDYGDVAGWERALIRLAEDRDGRKTMAAEAALLGQQFQWTEIAARLETVLESLSTRAPRHLTGAQARELVRYVGQGTLAVVREKGIAGLIRRAAAGEVF